jgi:hypothetical protein
MMQAVDMEGTIALVRADLSATWSEVFAGLKVAPKYVQFMLWLHGVTLPQNQPNQ